MTESNKAVLQTIRGARFAYQCLYRVNPFAALEYSASLLPGVRRCVEQCPAIEVSPDWPLAERLIEYKESGFAAGTWQLDRSLPA